MLNVDFILIRHFVCKSNISISSATVYITTTDRYCRHLAIKKINQSIIYLIQATRPIKRTNIKRKNSTIVLNVAVRVFNFRGFWATVWKTVRPMLSDRCLSVMSVCLSVCNIGVLWPNGLTDQDETSHAGRPRLWPH